MSTLDVYSGTYGFRITIETGRDLSATTTMRLRFRRPDGVNTDRSLNASNILAPATDGKVFYDTVNTDFSLPGVHQLQLFDETSGIKLATEILKVKVKPSLDYVG